jgi:hypothetical protein
VIADAGNRFPLDLQATDCQTGKIIATVTRDVASRDEIVHVAGVLGEELRRKMGEPAYLRGLAYLQFGDGVHAAQEFQKLLDHPGIVGTFVTGALAQLQLGRARAMAGDKIGARKSYQDFLSLWKDADRGIPIYKDAQVEYSRLN